MRNYGSRPIEAGQILEGTSEIDATESSTDAQANENGSFQFGPLTGIRVTEFGSFLAAPITARILGDFGAEVIKVESPRTGDQNRAWGKQEGGASYSWYLQARNKKSVTCDLHQEKGQDLARRLVSKSHIVIENFRPGKMAAWGLAYEELAATNPKLIMVHISGFGQGGPYRDRAGFGSVGEAMGGARYLTGEPGRPSVRTGFALGDSVSGIYGAFAAVAALRTAEQTGKGQEIDVAIYEAVLSLLDDVVLEYSATGAVRQPQGTTMNIGVPSNTYKCADGKPVIIGGNSDSVFRRLMGVIGRPDLATHPDYADNASRTPRARELDEIIGAWTKKHSSANVIEELNANGIPCGPIYTAADIAHDRHFRQREAVVNVFIPQTGRSLDMQGIIPKFTETPGSIRWPGPKLGSHNQEIYGGLLEIRDSEIEALRSEGVI